MRNFYPYLFGHLLQKVEGSIVIRPLEKASKAITLNDESFFGGVYRTKEDSSRGDKGWAMKRARPSQKV